MAWNWLIFSLSYFYIFLLVKLFIFINDFMKLNILLNFINIIQCMGDFVYINEKILKNCTFIQSHRLVYLLEPTLANLRASGACVFGMPLNVLNNAPEKKLIVLLKIYRRRMHIGWHSSGRDRNRNSMDSHFLKVFHSSLIHLYLKLIEPNQSMKHSPCTSPVYIFSYMNEMCHIFIYVDNIIQNLHLISYRKYLIQKKIK